MLPAFLGWGGNLVQATTDAMATRMPRKPVQKEEPVQPVSEEEKKDRRAEAYLAVLRALVIDNMGWGEEALLNKGGKDATAGFKGPQHPSRVEVEIEDYFIGHLLETKKAK